MKNYKANINYFKKWEGLKSLGLGMLIVGFGSIWLARSFLMYFGGISLLAAGAVLFLIGNINRSTEEEIRAEIARRSEGIDFPEVESERHFYKRVPEKQEILDFSGFSFSEGLWFKKMKNGSICSSEYLVAKMLLLTDAFYVKKRKFSLISDEKEEETLEIPLAKVEDVTVLRESKTFSCGSKSFPVKLCHLVITFEGGKTLCLPMADDVYVDELAARLKKAVMAERGE
ncbi:MAG: hypothetical protein E7606_02885 [Ruminococcaceae bacterium]|nr:hypothetical protein [Oscillospiraceae bacterium]